MVEESLAGDIVESEYDTLDEEIQEEIPDDATHPASSISGTIPAASQVVVQQGPEENPEVSSPRVVLQNDLPTPHNDSDLDEQREARRNTLIAQCQKRFKSLLFTGVLGQGAYGCVCLGVSLPAYQNASVSSKILKNQQIREPRMYAVKQIVLPPSHDKQASINSIWREVEITRGLRHKNIVEVLGAYRDCENVMSIVMKFYPGGTLAQLVEKIGRLNSDVVKHYTTEICRGVTYLHAHSIIHRDLKGANMLLDCTGGLRIGDFGSSREVNPGRGVRLDSLRGTPHWMAPEVIKQTGHGAAADVWSIGCTVIEMLTGRPPFSEFKAPHATMFAIANSTNPLPLPEEATLLCKKFLKSCLDRDDTMRPTSAQLLESDWVVSTDTSLQIHPHASPDQQNGFVGNNNMTSVQHYIRKLSLSYKHMAHEVLEQEARQITLCKRLDNGANGANECNADEAPRADHPKTLQRRFPAGKNVSYSTASSISYSSSIDNDEAAVAERVTTTTTTPTTKRPKKEEASDNTTRQPKYRSSGRVSELCYAALDAEIANDPCVFPQDRQTNAPATAPASSAAVPTSRAGLPTHKRRILPAPLRDCPVHIPPQSQRRKGNTPQRAKTGNDCKQQQGVAFDIHNRLSRSGSGRKVAGVAAAGGGGGGGGGGGSGATSCINKGRHSIKGPSPRRTRESGGSGGGGGGVAGAASGSPAAQVFVGQPVGGGGGGSPPLVRVLRAQVTKPTLAVLH